MAILRCEGRLIILADDAAVRSTAAQVSAHPSTIQLDEGALLVVSPGGDFSALTRDAVVSGAGEWIVFFWNGRTHVEPLRGSVALHQRVDDRETVLAASSEGGALTEEQRIARLKAAVQRWRAAP